MSDLSDATSSKINEMRFYYAESNNRLIDRINAAIRESKSRYPAIQPEISVAVKNMIDNKLQIVKESVVDHIAFGIGKFKQYYHPNDFDNAKSRRFSKSVIETLERSFTVDQYPSESEKIRLARACRLSSRQITNWFTNKRNRTKNNRHQ